MNAISWRLVLLQRQETVALDPSKSTHNNSITVFTKSLLTSHSDNHVLRCNIFNYLSQHILWYTSVFTDLQRSSNINIFSLLVSYIFVFFTCTRGMLFTRRSWWKLNLKTIYNKRGHGKRVKAWSEFSLQQAWLTKNLLHSLTTEKTCWTLHDPILGINIRLILFTDPLTLVCITFRPQQK